MDLKQASNLIQETFNSSFDRIKFIKFIKELLNEIDESKAQAWNKQYVKHAFHDGVKKYERIGTYTAPEGEKIDILIVYLEKETTLERARTLQRNFAAYHLKKRAEKDAGLVAFVSPNNDDWRFSLVKMEYNLEKTDSGKVKIQEELTPSKRFSFIVGKNENSHTAQKQLLPILKDDEHNPTFKEIEKAFSIETVTKEFFNKYKELFLNFKEELDKIVEKDCKIREDFEAKGINTTDFAKKLLGQIVFLYFLQRKGWLGVDKNEEWGDGPKNFLRALSDKKYCDYKNLFNEVLEPLFYEALATDRGEKAYYSRFDCRIPFLNGGLFEPLQNYDWENTDITIPNDLFSNDYKTKEGDTGSGILDFFDRYNFTIKEDEPLEKDVAIDPEMLGKVFENLLEIKDRKSKGTYYTPREIVHYMCQESLINYLTTELEGKTPREDIETFIHLGDFAVEYDMAKTQGIIKDDGKYKLPKSIHEHAELIDQKLADITVCDPAIGSGAFPVGMMNEIVRARGALNATKIFEKNKSKRTPYFFKRHAIQNSLYGVDIDSGAVEIAKLRLWLSLVVDEDDMTDIKPLPNLDYKIMQGNSLLEEYEGIKLFDESLLKSVCPTNDQELELLRKRKQEIHKLLLPFYQRNPDWMKNEKIDRPSELDRLENELKRVQLSIKQEEKSRIPRKQDQSALFSDNQAVMKIHEKLGALHKDFFRETRKTEKEILKKQIERLEWELIEATLMEQGKQKELPKLEKMKINNNKPFFLWKLHFAEVFEGKGGFDVVIANPPYVKEATNKSIFDGLRNAECYQGKMDFWYLFGCHSINILKKNGVMCFIATNNWVSNDGASKFRNKILKQCQIVNFIDFRGFKVFSAGIQTMVFVLVKSRESQSYNLKYGCLKNNDADSEVLLDFLRTKYGCENKHFVKYDVSFDSNEFVDKYVNFLPPHIDKILKKIRDKSDFHLTKDEIFSGIDVLQDFVSKKHLATLKDDFKVGDGIFVLSKKEKNAIKWTDKEKVILKPYYSTKEINRYFANTQNQYWIVYAGSKINKNISHFLNIKSHLDQFKKIMTSVNKPYGLHRTRNPKIFLGPKIFSIRKCSKPSFSFVDFPCYVSRAFLIIRTNKVDNMSLLGILNSKIIKFWLTYKGKLQGNQYQVDQVPLLNIPLVKIDQSEKKKVQDLVTKILKVKKQSPDADICDLENEVNQIIYRIYDLSPREIQIIESSL